MTAWSTSKHPGRIWLRHSITLVLGAVAVCLLLAGIVQAVVGSDRGTPVADVTAESIPEPGADESTPAAVIPVPAAPPAQPIGATDDGGADASPGADIPQAFPVVVGPNDAGTVDGGPADAGLPDTGPGDAAPIDSAPDATPAVVACGAAVCATGLVCCNASCGTCVAPGQNCSQLTCGMPVIPSSVSCGRNTCNVGELCCNASCGTCVKPGQTCDQTRRCSGDIEYIGESQMCGMQTCNVGYACCNPSCGICKKPGEPCSQTPCT